MRPFGLRNLEREISPLKIHSFTCDRCGNAQHVAQHPDQREIRCIVCEAVHVPAPVADDPDLPWKRAHQSRAMTETDANGYDAAADGWTELAILALARAAACRQRAASIRTDVRDAQFAICERHILAALRSRDEEFVASVAERLASARPLR